MKLKELHFADIAKIQKAVTGELKNAPPKGNFRQLFKNHTTAQEPLYMLMEIILN
jgi:hypothetical protein